MTARTQKRVCLLTGASGTLGTAFCRAHAADYEIAAVYRARHPEVASTVQRYIDPLTPGSELPENRHPVFAIRADLGKPGERERVVELALARFDTIDLVVNAAVCSLWANMDSDTLANSVEAQFKLNVEAPFALSNLIARHYWRKLSDENARSNRNVVNISSLAALRVYPRLGQSVYAASKAALNQLTLHMAEEYRAFGVRVNAVAPNSFPSIVAVEDVVQTIRQLDLGDMNGKILVIDDDGENGNEGRTRDRRLRRARAPIS
jgi:NAD(P)-dependent dehydrogenase (short-subunit alcohol dehydrogenase family)